MSKSKIAWTEYSWNPTTGCSKTSPGCDNCYASVMANRLKAMGQAKYSNGFQPSCHSHELTTPLSWKKSKRIFVSSMGDLFHSDIPDSFIGDVFAVAAQAPQHNYLLLTKRSRRLMDLSPQLPWRGNIWAGVTVENANYQFRIEHLRSTGATIKFVSFEPLLGPVPNLDLAGISWVIVGGESGFGFRPMDPDWVRDIRDQCIAANVLFFFKQWSGRWPKKLGRQLDGRIWNQSP